MGKLIRNNLANFLVIVVIAILVFVGIFYYCSKHQTKASAQQILAINTNKSIYLLGETAYLQIAVLQDDGHTICDANLKLEMVSPSRSITILEVEKSGKCGPSNVVDVPDYFAYYQVEEVGIYQMKLTNLGDNYEIIDSFEVRETVPFEIERIGPTRIYPPAEYSMKIRIKANQDFQGEIEEYVPAEFKIITKQATSRIRNEDKLEIIWQNIDWRAGETHELEYQFDAPDISPYLYLLGPLKMLHVSGYVFQEARQWQIASDQTAYDYSGGSSVNWIDEANAWNSSDGNYASRDIPSGTGDSGNYLLGSTVSAPGSENITKVEIGIESYVEGEQITAHLIPVFGGTTDGAGTYTIAGVDLGTSDDDVTDYVDITNDANAPSWQWSDVEALDVRIYADNSHPSQGRFFYIDQIKVRVTIAPANQAPTINEVSLNSKGTINLIENTTIDIMASASVYDANGCADISGVKAIVYHYSTYTASCSDDPNNCYDEDRFTCFADGACSSNTQPYNCYASSSMQFFADPSDAGSSFSADQWVVTVIASDSYWEDASSNSYDDNDETPVDINTLTALEVTVGDPISYGEVVVGQNTEAVNQTVTIKNTGNHGIDIMVYGTNLTGACGTITVGNQQYASTSFTYNDYGETLLVSPGERYYNGQVSWLKPTSATPITNDIYWGINVPEGTGNGICNGTNTFSATTEQ